MCSFYLLNGAGDYYTVCHSCINLVESLCHERSNVMIPSSLPLSHNLREFSGLCQIQIEHRRVGVSGGWMRGRWRSNDGTGAQQEMDGVDDRFDGTS